MPRLNLFALLIAPAAKAQVRREALAVCERLDRNYVISPDSRSCVADTTQAAMAGPSTFLAQMK